MTPQTINEATELLIAITMADDGVSREVAIARLFGVAALGVMCDD
jgi:hypothetical protein